MTNSNTHYKKQRRATIWVNGILKNVTPECPVDMDVVVYQAKMAHEVSELFLRRTIKQGLRYHGLSYDEETGFISADKLTGEYDDKL